MTTTDKTVKLSVNDRYFVNTLTGAVTLNVVGSLHQGRLGKKVAAILAALPEGSYTPAPKALWRHYVDSNVRGGTDAYEIRFMAKNIRAVDQALFAMKYPRLAGVWGGMYFSRIHWDRYSGKTDWLVPGKPGSGLVHTVCGKEIKVVEKTVTLWLPHSVGLGPCAVDEQTRVGFLYCTHCHPDETYPNVLESTAVVEKLAREGRGFDPFQGGQRLAPLDNLRDQPPTPRRAYQLPEVLGGQVLQPGQPDEEGPFPGEPAPVGAENQPDRPLVGFVVHPDLAPPDPQLQNPGM